MLGILYIIISFLSGLVTCSFALPNLFQAADTTFTGRPLKASRYLVLLPAWYLTGTLLMTWTTYVLAFLFRNNEQPLFIANMIAMSIYLVISVAGILLLVRKKLYQELKGGICSLTKLELIMLAGFAILTYELMWTTFFISHNQLYVGLSVFSDFSPHLGMIRSFSYGNNFPTTYSHFAGSDIRYHFMFQFLVGNLEFLGLRLDYAFNLPSWFSLMSTYSLLYLLACKLSGKRLAGFLALVFFTFRSSRTLFTYLASRPKELGVWEYLFGTTEFLGDTPNESWGLWNLNVYCNQRHFAFGLSVLLLVLILFLPHLFEMAKRRSVPIKEEGLLKRLKQRALFSFCTKEGWQVRDIKLAVFCGILLGLTAFFNGAVLIASLGILFILAIASDRRLEFLIAAVIATILSFLQSSFFINGQAITPKFYFGFIAEQKTIFGVLEYIFKLFGILPLVLFIAFLLSKAIRKYIMSAFALPFLLAFTLSLTVDVTVNHKYIMISVMLLNIFAAIFIVNLLSIKKISFKIVSGLLIVMLTATGVYDYVTVMRRNAPKNNLVFNLKDEITMWVRSHADSKDIFLTSNYALNPVVLGGAMLYLGWPYFGWSAGYDTEERSAIVKDIYETDDKAYLKTMVQEQDIRYIIIDHDNRISKDYDLNEITIPAAYECVFETGEGIYKTTIYDTDKPIG